MLKTVGFQIKIPLSKETYDSKKHLNDFHKGLTDLDKKTLPKLTKTTREYLKTTRDGLKETTSAVERFGNAFSESMRKGLEGLHRLDDKLHRSRERIFGLKQAFEATAIGAATFYAADKLMEGGRAEMRARARVRREFGGEAGFITEASERAARRAGLEGAQATQMLIPLAETLRDTVQAGARFRGLRGPLSAASAAELRRRNLEIGSSLMTRMAILNPELAPSEIGHVMNDALTGPEGIRSMIAAFGLSKRSRSLSEANEKGQAFKALSPEERKQLGITKAGQYVQQADLVRLMLERSGFTAAAATDQMKTLDFQFKAIGNSFKNVFGEVGSSMLSKLDSGLSKGGTLAERLNEYLDKNKDSIHHVGEALGSAAQSVGEFAIQLPKIGSFLTEHKTLLLSLGAGFGVLKAGSYVGGMFENAKKIPGIGGLAGGAKGLPVYVTNWGGGGETPGLPGSKGGGLLSKIAAGGVLSGFALAGAGAAAAYGGGKLGLYLNDHSTLANRFYTNGATLIDRTFGGGFARAEDYEVMRNRMLLGARANKQQSLTQSLEAAGLTHGQALALAQGTNREGFNVQRGDQTIHVSLTVDGKVLAESTIPHITRHIRNATADGAAPTWR